MTCETTWVHTTSFPWNRHWRTLAKTERYLRVTCRVMGTTFKTSGLTFSAVPQPLGERDRRQTNGSARAVSAAYDGRYATYDSPG